MKLLEDRIRKDGVVKPGNIVKIDKFLNHQIDVKFLDELGAEFYRLFKDSGVTKLMTIEASGIAIACLAALHFDVPVIFAKKNKTKNIADEVYKTRVFSYTHGVFYDVIVSKEFLRKGDKVLLIDDVLANGKALLGLVDLCDQAGAEVVGAGIVMEKTFQPGRQIMEEKGIRVESLARISHIDDGKITFVGE